MENIFGLTIILGIILTCSLVLYIAFLPIVFWLKMTLKDENDDCFISEGLTLFVYSTIDFFLCLYLIGLF